MIRITGDIRTAFAVDLPMSESQFDALTEDEQKAAIAEDLRLRGLGADKDIDIQTVEEV